MAAFYWTTRAKPAGWAFGEILTSAQQNTVDANAAQCPSEFTVAPNFAVGFFSTGDGQIDQDLLILGALVGAGTTTLSATDVSSLGVSGNTDLDGDVNIGSSVADDIQVFGELTVNEAAEFTADVDVSGTLTAGIANFKFPTAALGDADAALTANTLHRAGGLTATRNYTLPTVVNGKWCLVHNASAQDADISDGGGVIAVLSGTTRVGLFAVFAGTWRSIGRWDV